MASVIGLAPISPDLKGRLLELLCIHGRKWSPKLVSRQRLLLFREALICLSYSGMNVVVPAGTAPASSGYQPGALLLSYETMADGVGIAPTQPGGSLGFRDRGITALPTIRNGQGGRSCTLVAVRKHPPRSEQGRLLLTLHPEIGCQGWTRTNTERLNRPPCYFDTIWQSL